MNMHIHDSYELYYSISGGKQFLIDNRSYNINPGDIFFINQYESHHLTQIDKEIHERIVLSIYPDYLRKLCSPSTDIDNCFHFRERSFGHKLSLNPEEQQRFLYYIHKISSIKGYGEDLLEQAVFIELMVFLNKLFTNSCKDASSTETETYNKQVDAILTYINQNIRDSLTIDDLSEHFFLSSSYICRIFKSTTGTTIKHKLIF